MNMYKLYKLRYFLVAIVGLCLFFVPATLSDIDYLGIGYQIAAAASNPSPVRQEQDQLKVFALPGTLREARGQPFGNYLIAEDGKTYGIMGETPAIEEEIDTYRELGPDTVVKVWGELLASGDVFEIVVSDILPADPNLVITYEPTPTPTPDVPVATVIYPTVNVRAGPGTAYTPVGGLSNGQSCEIIGRNRDNSWWQIRCSDGLIGWVFSGVVNATGNVASAPVITVAAPPPTATPVPAATTGPTTFFGWKASYFPNRDLSGSPVLIQDVPEINFNWGAGAPAPNLPADNFSIRFERNLDFNGSNYEFVLRMDDGARLWVNNELIIDDWREESQRDQRASRVLSGNLPIRVEYFEGGGNAVIQLTINQNSGTGNPQPGNPSDWRAEYYNNVDLAGNPVVTRFETRSPYPLDYNWGTGSPVPGTIGNDNWSARWRGNYYFDPGDYTFQAQSDDGIRVYIDGQRIIDAWSDGYKEPSNRFLGLGGGSHEITIEFYERSGGARAKVWWYKDNSDSGGGRHRDE